MKLSFILFLFALQAVVYPQSKTDDYKASINGKILITDAAKPGIRYSPNGVYKCIFSVGDVTDETRILNNLTFYENDIPVYAIGNVPGSDAEISNSGLMVLYDHTFHFKNELTLKFIDKSGYLFFEKYFYGANGFLFSESGNSFAVRDRNNIYTFNLINNSTHQFDKGLAFSFDETDRLFVTADNKNLSIYKDGTLLRVINTETEYPRKVILSSEHNLAGIIDKYNFKVYRISDWTLTFSDRLEGNDSFRDLKLVESEIVAGIQTKEAGIMKGSLKIYSTDGSVKKIEPGEERIIKTTKPDKSFLEKINQYDPIPWPFIPHDTTHTVWNHHEQHMGGGPDYSYLHQGLDIITPIGEPTYAVKGGIVKCVLTLGGAIYWRIAISDSNIADYSDGWLYAHLIESTIAFDVGDTVQQFDYLGDIIEWTNEWGHIHFIEIRDTGFVWLYDDNEWGINFNPLLALTPVHDNLPPQIENVFPDQKFGFCENETSNYLQSDNLIGEVDIIVKVVDYIGDSEWQQPAYKITYWINRVEDGALVLDTTLSHVLNHSYPMYSSGSYEPYATVLYKRDQNFPSPAWMNPVRNYYHIITNNNGDSLITLSDKDFALNTADFVDGEYRIFVSAFDPNENFTTDSMDVYFNNGITSVNNDNSKIFSFRLEQNYPNPFNPITKIRFTIPFAETHRDASLQVTLKVYDILGNEITTIVNEEKPAGSYSINFDGSKLSSGVYFYQIRAGSFVETKKMILLQ